jgi:diacylglycerol kinase family enzyme
LALEAARAGFPVVAAAGGDGTVHEVANGLLRAGRDGVTLGVYPVGSANDYAHSLAFPAAWASPDGQLSGVRKVDVGLVRAPGRPERYFVNGLGLGFNGAVTLESRRIKGLQGVPLYSAALFRALCFHFAAPVMRIRLDGEERRGPTLALSVNLGRREGNFVLTPHAQLDDGWFDFLLAGKLRRWELLRFFPNIVTGRLPENHPQVATGRCREVQLASEAALIAHTDGEFFCRPEDGVQTLEVRLLPGALGVQLGQVP